jgi:uncharacterized oxidoreductase
MLIPSEKLQAFVETIFTAAGSNADEARSVAAHLVEANLTGHDSHGVSLIPEYLRNVELGNVRPNETGNLVRRDGSILVYDGNLGYGQVVANIATDIAIETAKASGLALLALRNCHHIGRIGAYGERCAAQGLAAVQFVNAVGNRPRVAPHGGRDARLPTNPICVAVPATRRRPAMVLDMATSKIAQGKVRIARNSGTHVGEGFLLDGRGEPTTDPQVMFDTVPGAILPFGEHKGYGLSLMCEVLAGAFTGGPTIQPGNPQRGASVNGMLMIVFDPARTSSLEEARREIDELIDYVTASPPRDPEQPVLVPGDPERAMKALRSSGGVPIDDGTWNRLLEAAGTLNVAYRE